MGVVFELLKREKSGKKRASYCLFWPILYGGFNRVCDSIVFSMNNLKQNDMRASCILEKLRFLTKYGHNSRMFFREWTIFDKIWA